MNTDIIDKFTTHLKGVLTRALCLVLETKEAAIEPIHLFWALATQKGSIGAEILSKAKVVESAVEALFKNSTAKLPLAPPQKEPSVGDLTPKLGALAKRAIEKAVLTANIYEHKYVGTEHLLSGLLQIDDAAVKKFFDEHQIELKTLRQQVTLVLKSTSKFPDLAASLGVPGEHELSDPAREPVRERRRKKVGSKTPALDFFSVDLTNADVQANVDPVIGREAEIERMMQILCRRTKNNPILLGDPGVGKTALVEGLAKKIGASEVPEALRGKRILALDLSLIIAGTMYRGEFEGRLKQIIDEVKTHPEIVLFIDEVHTIIGAGSASGSLDAANILKPALSRGEIRCIGATTLAEYKKHIESDPALERRFQSVMVNEPTPAATRTILEGIKKNYEAYHGVVISKDAVAAAVDFADRYLQEKFFPDKAIDLIDEAASALRIREKPSATERRIRECEEELARIREEKRQAVIDERFIEAISLKEQERGLEEDLRKLERKVTKRKRALHGRVTARHIAEIVSRMTGVPVLDLLETERKMLLELEGTLSKRILGQGAVVKTVADCVRRAKAGIAQPNRPLASFLFVGPSGVGKTELAKTLALEVFQDKDALIRLDMSEFSEGFTISKLIGAPAGYVGYKDSAKLTDSVKRKPYSVVLFDELEKAHGDVLNLLLQILDDGHLTDATGKKINFKNTIVIMTSNIGSDKLREQEMGFGASAGEFRNLNADIQGALRERFRPEFLNRIDRVCVFSTLDHETLTRIVELQIEELATRLVPKHVSIEVAPEVRAWIIAQGASAEQGARGIRRTIQNHLEGLIAAYLLEAAPTSKTTLRFIMRDNAPALEP